MDVVKLYAESCRMESVTGIEATGRYHESPGPPASVHQVQWRQRRWRTNPSTPGRSTILGWSEPTLTTSARPHPSHMAAESWSDHSIGLRSLLIEASCRPARVLLVVVGFEDHGDLASILDSSPSRPGLVDGSEHNGCYLVMNLGVGIQTS